MSVWFLLYHLFSSVFSGKTHDNVHLLGNSLCIKGVIKSVLALVEERCITCVFLALIVMMMMYGKQSY